MDVHHVQFHNYISLSYRLQRAAFLWKNKFTSILSLHTLWVTLNWAFFLGGSWDWFFLGVQEHFWLDARPDTTNEPDWIRTQNPLIFSHKHCCFKIGLNYLPVELSVIWISHIVIKILIILVSKRFKYSYGGVIDRTLISSFFRLFITAMYDSNLQHSP